jgi:hypothetical protein
MEQIVKLKLFICYSHLDEKHVNEFIKHLAPLKNNGLIEEWYDRKIIPGQAYQNTIDSNLETSDIVCLFISADFLNSPACMDEKNRVLELRKKSGVFIIPIILSECGWLDDKEISTLLAIPLDGKPISTFPDSASAWNNVYKELKRTIENEIEIKKLEIAEQFKIFLNSTELLGKAHSHKTDVLLEDIFVYPELIKYNDVGDYDDKLSSEKLVQCFGEGSKILIAGEDQSGKTTLCKKMFVDLRKKNFVPVYISDKTTQFQGLIKNRIKDAFQNQYQSDLFEKINKNKIVPIIDDFHFARRKEKHIRDLSDYCNQIVIVDDIFSLNFEDENLMKSFNQYKFKQFSPSLRNKLIEKWVYLNDSINNKNARENEIYKGIDNTTELVNTALGKIISSGIMPAYPFFILTIISSYETFEKPIDQEITSQGYCYQALIYIYLRKQGVKNDEVDTYLNFLTEFAFFLFKEKKQELSLDDFKTFMKAYLDKFNLPVKQEILIQHLVYAKIIQIDSCNNYSFIYKYLYYYFIAKYLAEHNKDCLEIINDIISNLHKNENAYIAIFISHHSKSIYFLDEIIKNALHLFDKYSPATLTKEELQFFDDKLDNIIKAVLPPENTTPAKNRAERLRQQDEIEHTNNHEDNGEKTNSEMEDNTNSLAKDLRRSIRTVEVMGIIIKNRAGSLQLNILEKVFEEALKVHLRILTSFFELIKDEKKQYNIVSYIQTRLKLIVKDKSKKPGQEQLEKMSKLIFWNMNFSVILGFLNKAIHSLGSDKLQIIIDKVCNGNNTPAYFLVKHGILMWYSKNLQIDNIADRIDDNDFSETAKRIMRFIIVNHCSLHPIGYKEKQRVENKLKIPSQRLIVESAKYKEQREGR